MPEREQDVLLSLRSLDVCKGFMSNIDGMFYVSGSLIPQENVLAWLPIPEPYKESECDEIT